MISVVERPRVMHTFALLFLQQHRVLFALVAVCKAHQHRFYLLNLHNIVACCSILITRPNGFPCWLLLLSLMTCLVGAPPQHHWYCCPCCHAWQPAQAHRAKMMVAIAVSPAPVLSTSTGMSCWTCYGAAR